MQLILAADIFGKTPEFVEIADALAPLAGGTVMVDPYQGAAVDFTCEDRAYAHFRKHASLDRYARDVRDAVESSAAPMLLVGFSVGAAAIWIAAAEIKARAGVRALCFYGSQIRHWPGLAPGVEVEIFLPHAEPHFDVPVLGRTLALKKKVRVQATPYGHGFMNRRSKNFDPAGYSRYLREIETRLAAS